MLSRCQAAAVAVFLIGCGAENTDTALNVRIDTLPGGAVVTRNSGTELWNDGDRWSVVEDLSIGMADGPSAYVFGIIGPIAVDSSGRIWVTDRTVPELRAFSPDGSHLRTIGRSGAGPGEFRSVGGLYFSPTGELWIEDTTLRRIEIFDTTGTRLHGIATNDAVVRTSVETAWAAPDTLYRVLPRHGGGRTYTAPNGVSMTIGMGGAVVRYHWNGSDLVPVDTVDLPDARATPLLYEALGPNGPRTSPLPYVDVADLEIGPSGHVWVTAGKGEYRVLRQLVNGDTLRILGREITPLPLPDSISKSVRIRMEQGTLLGEASPPEAFPVISSVHPGQDGTLWVRRRVGVNSYLFEVFDAEGRFLGSPRFEDSIDLQRFRLQVVGRDVLYGTVRDEMGVDRVLRLRVEKP